MSSASVNYKYSILFDKSNLSYISNDFRNNRISAYYTPIGVENFNLCNTKQYADINSWNNFDPNTDKNKIGYFNYKKEIINRLGSMFLKKICNISENNFEILPNITKSINSNIELKDINLIYDLDKFTQVKSDLLSEIVLPNMNNSELVIKKYNNSLKNISLGDNTNIKFDTFSKEADTLIIPKVYNIKELSIYDYNRHLWNEQDKKKIISNGFTCDTFSLEAITKEIDFTNIIILDCKNDIHLESETLIFNPKIKLKANKIGIKISGHYQKELQFNDITCKYLNLVSNASSYNIKINKLNINSLSINVEDGANITINKLIIDNSILKIDNTNYSLRNKYMKINISNIESPNKIIELQKDNHIIVYYKNEEVKKGRIYV